MQIVLTQTEHAFDVEPGTLWLEIPRCTSERPEVWADPQMINFRFNASFNGGETWVDAGGFEASGGVHVDRHGNESQTTMFKCPYPKRARVRLFLSAPVDSVAWIS